MCEQVAREILFLVLEILWDDSVFSFSKKNYRYIWAVRKIKFEFPF